MRRANKAYRRQKRSGVLGQLVIWIACMIVSVAAVGAETFELVDRIVAVVNSNIVTLYDLNRAFRPYEENIKALKYPPEKERETLFQVRNDILNKLIYDELADQEIKRNQITVSEKEIDSAIERMKEARYLTDEQLREGLSQQGMTMEEYRQEIKDQVMRAKLVNREVRSKIVITKEDIQKYYDSHQEKYAGAEQFNLWNLFVKVPPDAGATEKTDARRQLDAVAAKLKQGASFEAMVKETSESTTAVRGTDLGVFRLEELSEQLKRVIKNMKPGEFSGVLDADFGFQIIYLQNIMTTPSKPLAEVESEIQQILYNESVDNKYQEWLDDLRQRSHIKIIN